MPSKTELFLERATAGLATDPELRLDVQAELRSHIEDKQAELGGGDHADEAVASLGEVVELAEEVAAANRRRLGWRVLARRLLRFALVPAAVLCALWFSGLREILSARQFEALLNGDQLESRPLPGWLDRSRKLSQQEQMLLYGYTNRHGAENYCRILWEQNPTNAVYYAAHITRLMYPPERRLAALAEAPAVDPENSRYPFLTAMIHLREAAACETVKGDDGNVVTYALEPKDRPALDRGMADLLAATGLPVYRCYHLEMLHERLAVLGPPDRLLDTVERTAIAASVLLPDLSELREAARYSIAYAELLIAEGRGEEAVPYLEIPECLARHVTKDSLCLIEMLVSHALTSMAQDRVPRLLRQIGHETQAQAVETRSQAVSQPMRQWRESQKQPNPEMAELLNRYAGGLAGMLLPALGLQDPADLAPRLATSRRLEFVVMTEAITGMVGLLLVAAMTVCLVISLRWRLTLGAQSAPLLLLPSWRDMLRFVLLGVILPFAVFLVWTRWLPFSGHAYSMKYAGHRAAAEFVALLLALLLVPGWLASRAFRRRCLELELPPPPHISKLLRTPLTIAGLGLLIGFSIPGGFGMQPGLLVVQGSAAIAVLVFLVLAGLALFSSRRHGRTIGTLSRSLIPVFATAILILGLVVQPILRHRERHLLRADTILWLGDEPGFTNIEAELINRLRQDTLDAMAKHPLPPPIGD
jgi:hypothetical protein